MPQAQREMRSIKAVGEALLPVEADVHGIAATASRAIAVMIEERHRASLPANFGSEALAECAKGVEHLVAAANCFGGAHKILADLLSDLGYGPECPIGRLSLAA